MTQTRINIKVMFNDRTETLELFCGIHSLQGTMHCLEKIIDPLWLCF